MKHTFPFFKEYILISFPLLNTRAILSSDNCVILLIWASFLNFNFNSFWYLVPSFSLISLSVLISSASSKRFLFPTFDSTSSTSSKGFLISISDLISSAWSKGLLFSISGLFSLDLLILGLSSRGLKGALFILSFLLFSSFFISISFSFFLLWELFYLLLFQ